MAHKIKVGAVSYLNTKPLIYGFEQGMMADEIDLVIDYPANVAKMLIENKSIKSNLGSFISFLVFQYKFKNFN